MQSVVYNVKNFKLNSIFIKFYGFLDAFPLRDQVTSILLYLQRNGSEKCSFKTDHLLIRQILKVFEMKI